MVLHGKIGTEIEIKAPADKLYNTFKSAHLIPNISSAHIKGVDVHEGDWETHGSIKIWKYELGKYKFNFYSCLNIHYIRMTLTDVLNVIIRS